jgi:hypothetical protein
LLEPKRWKQFYEWLENNDGYRKIKQWAKDYVKEHGRIEKSERAPTSETKSEMISESHTDSMRFLIKPFELLRRMPGLDRWD